MFSNNIVFFVCLAYVTQVRSCPQYAKGLLRRWVGDCWSRIFTHTDSSRGSMAIIHVCLCVSVCVSAR